MSDATVPADGRPAGPTKGEVVARKPPDQLPPDGSVM